MRTAHVERITKETKVTIDLGLDGSGTSVVTTGVGMFDHLLTALAHHGMFDLTINTAGDLEIDDHHTVEDTALVLGSAFADALGDRAGIQRYGDAVVAMDEAIARAAVDVGGRPYSVSDLQTTGERIGNLTLQNVPHALEAFARTAGFTIHLEARGSNDHHIVEAAFKALARALRAAVEIDPRRVGIPSTKGTT
jgi:imidazoleglycerol-phosphate dehydratase